MKDQSWRRRRWKQGAKSRAVRASHLRGNPDIPRVIDQILMLRTRASGSEAAHGRVRTRSQANVRSLRTCLQIGTVSLRQDGTTLCRATKLKQGVTIAILLGELALRGTALAVAHPEDPAKEREHVAMLVLAPE